MGEESSIRAALLAEVNVFIQHEAALLDRRRWEEWLALFAPDGRLWSPAWNGDEVMTADPAAEISLIYADRDDLAARIFRIEGEDSYASVPLPLTTHLVSCTAAQSQEDGLLYADANWLVHSFWRTRGATLRAGHYEYQLRRIATSFSIVLKKVVVHDDRVEHAIDIYSI